MSIRAVAKLAGVLVFAALPAAAPAVRDALIAWLDTFAGYVREVDYASARPLFHKDALAFGTFTNVIPGLEA